MKLYYKMRERGRDMKRKILVILLTMILVIITLGSAYGDTPKTKLRVDAVSAIAIDASSGMVLFNQNGHSVIPMASTTKIMTTLVTLQEGDLDREVEVSKNAASIRGSKVGYNAGEKVSLRELLYGLMLRSGNDCAIAIAEGIGGSVEGFCKKMNETAVSIGLVDSHFESPHGLDSQSHYSSAYDLALVTRKAKEIDEFNKIVSTKLINEEEGIKFSREFNNINKLLYQEPNCTGVKTGYTGQAGKCLVSSFKIGSNEIIVVTLNCTPRWKESQRIYEYVKENYDFKTVLKAGQVMGEVKTYGREENTPLVVKEDVVLPVRKDEELSIDTVIPDYELQPPVDMGEDVGAVIIKNNNGDEITVSLHLKEDIQELNIFEKIKQFILH